MEQRYVNVCKQLIDLGYPYTIQPESLLLVEKLLGDLIETTDNLRKYMKIAQDAAEERDNLKFGAEPYICDNARLIKECNELHLAFIQIKEQNEKQQKGLSQQIVKLEKEKQEFIINHKKLRDRLREFELDAVRKSDRFYSRQSGNKVKSNSTSVLLNTQKDKSNNFQINSAMALADQKISNLMKEIAKLKDHQLELAEVNNEIKNKLIAREKEIQRLTGLLEGGRPINAINADCCYQNINTKLQSKDTEISYLQKTKIDLENKLKDARCKQHEAMKNALHLADRNNQLERELRDIDQMALAVEEECNSTVKCNSKKVKRIQDRLHTTTFELQQLEKQAADLKRDKQSLQADLEAIKIEKRHLQTVLETALEDKKRLTDRINKFTIIEKDLNKEIDSLVRTSTEQKRLIAELKGRALAGNYQNKFLDESIKVVEESKSQRKTEKPSKQSKKNPSRKIITSTKKNDPKITQTIADIYNRNIDPYSEQNVPTNTPVDVNPINYSTIQQKNAHESNLSVEKIKEIVDDEITKRVPQQTNSLDRIKNERDFYIKEYQHLLEQFRNVQIRPEENEKDSTLIKKLHEKEETIVNLQHENQTLSKEKHNLMSRLENIRDYSDNNDYLTMKSSMKRLERERDLLKTDVDRLEEERDSIKHRIKVSTDLHTAEIERYQKMITDNETQIRKFEQERHDIAQNQGSRRATITNLEDQCETLKEQLKRTQDELAHQRTVYSQLKILHEQTDKALADSQGQLMQVEKELSNYQNKHNSFDNNAAILNEEIIKLRKDIEILKQNLNEMDQEKDNILLKVDEKTERIAILEQEIIFKDGKINQLDSNLSDLRGKVSSTLDDRNSKEYQLKTTSSEMTNLKSDLHNIARAKEAAFQENRRLQDDLAACTANARKCQNELEIAKRQIDDMKTQLQHYVAEVKRIEDLMAHKEIERSEMLDHFRSLSHEATVLESSNHSLENVASQTKVQLSVALDHSTDLERKVDEQQIMIRGYEREITELTSQVARLEIEMKHYQNQLERAESDLKSSQDLCVKLDKQKDEFQKQLREQELEKSQIERNINRMRSESESIQRTMEKDQSTVGRLESLLADNRQESVEQRLLNQELQSEVVRLKKKIEEMSCNLLSTTEKLDIYQEKALEYSHQNKQLRREISNERFLQWKDDQSSTKNLEIQDILKSRNMNSAINDNASTSSDQHRVHQPINHLANKPSSGILRGILPSQSCEKRHCSKLCFKEDPTVYEIPFDSTKDANTNTETISPSASYQGFLYEDSKNKENVPVKTIVCSPCKCKPICLKSCTSPSYKLNLYQYDDLGCDYEDSN